MPKNSSDQYLHWVVIETGGNQRYIFGSDRLRHVVGGSELLRASCTDWVEAICPREEIAQSLSGKAILLVDSLERGRQVVREISSRALREAPGMEITGAVGLPFNPDLRWYPDRPIDPPPQQQWDPERVDHVTALHATFARQRRARAARPAQELRFRGLPWHLPCHETGLPACGRHSYGTGDVQPVSDGLLARTGQARRAGEDRMSALLDRREVPETINDLGGDGWVGVVHADGNRVGGLMTRFPCLVARAVGTTELGLQQHKDYLKAVAGELDQATQAAFTAAIREVKPGPQQVLPILVGGDDVTFVCHAALAVPLTKVFLREFAARTRATTHLSALAVANGDPSGGLTAAAGIAFVKRHHPLAYAVDLAEQLTKSAKRGTRPGNTTLEGDDSAATCFTAYDVHVAHDSTIKKLSQLRQDRARGDVAGHAGPFVMDDVTSDETSLPERLRPRHERHFCDLLKLLDSREVSAARAHDLREAFDRGPSAYRQRLAVAAADLDERGRELLDLREADGTRFLLLPDALLLRGVTTSPLQDAEVAVR